MLDKEKTMKKKGLIISTVVMVVVLIASLTTATYAWFSVSTKTTVDGFNLEVVAGNAVNIGLRKNLSESYNAGDLTNKFVTGDVSFDGGTPGTLNSGNWSGGTDGLGPQLTHNINFGSVERAVAFTTESDASTITNANTHYAPSSMNGQKVVSAAKSATSDELTDKHLAVANGYTPEDGQVVAGDYAYLWLGVSPAKNLAEGAILHVYVQSTGGGTQLGIAAAVHVAYSVNGTEWVDIDAFEGKNYRTARTSAQTQMPTDAKETYGDAVIKGSTQNGMADVPINLTKTQQGEMDQVQLIVYLAGNDPDCINEAKGVTAKIGLYFETIETDVTTTTTAENLTGVINESGILTVTNGVNGAVVEYTYDAVIWRKANGTWSGTTFTSLALTSLKDKTNVKIRIRETGKLSSTAVVATNNFKTT